MDIKQIAKGSPSLWRTFTAAYLHSKTAGGSEGAMKFLHEEGVPFEICLTSNLWCKSVPSLNDHHVRLLHEIRHPFVLCTDDKGAFGEYTAACRLGSHSMVKRACIT